MKSNRLTNLLGGLNIFILITVLKELSKMDYVGRI